MLCLGLASTAVWCQDTSWSQAAPLRFETFGPEDDLPHRRVTAIVQDHRGFLWLGTQNGLARYDGYRFKVFEHAFDDPNSLADNYVLSLAVTPDGTLWIGTKNGGLNAFDHRRETFRRIVIPELQGENRGHQSVNNLVATANGDLWLGLPSSWRHYRPGDASQEPAPLLEDGILVASGVLDGSLWHISPQAISHVSREGQAEIRFRFPAAVEILSALDDGQGRLWLVLPTHLAFYDLNSDQWTPNAAAFDIRAGRSVQEPRQPILQDRHGSLWFGLTGQGLFTFDPQGQRLQQFRHQASQPSSLMSDYLLTMTEDRNGLLWLGSLEGLSKLDPTRQGVLQLRHDPDDPTSLSEASVLAVHRGPSGRLWIGHFGTGIDEVDSSGKVIRRLTTQSEPPSRLASDVVWALLEDPFGNLWIGSEAGLEHFDPTTGSLRYFPASAGRAESEMQRIITLARDHSGVLWAGTATGLAYFDAAAERLVDVPYPPDSASSSHVLALLADSQGHLWIGTDGDGLYRLHLATRTFEVFRHRPDDSGSLGHDIVSGLHEADGVLWISTIGGGLIRHTLGSDRFLSLAPRHPFVSSTITSLLSTSDGDLWLPADRGLNRYSPGADLLQTWDASDGLPQRGFNSKASFVDGADTLFLGSTDGVFVMSPKTFGTDLIPPIPVITGLRILNNPVLPKHLDPTSPLDVSITETQSLELSHQQFLFALDFSGLQYTNPSKNRYRYRLHGVDPEWVQSDSGQRSAQYAHVSPGKYLFEVYASNRDGVESEVPARLQITVLPPPWRTWWAYTLYGLILVAALAAFVRAQRRKVEQEREINRQLDELVAARTEQVKMLRGLLPICAGCKKVRDDEGYWNEVESYVEERTEAVFSHSMCPPCVKRMYPDLDLAKDLETTDR